MPPSPDLLAALAPEARDTARLHQEWIAATPCPHVALGRLLDEPLARALAAEFPPTQADVLAGHRERGGRGGKSKIQQIAGLGPAFRRLDELLGAPPFLGWLEQVTGIRGLKFDPDYYGGGTHESLHGEGLLPHIDFNVYPGRRWYRRLNLLLYLNDEWSDDWGGLLDLHEKPRDPVHDRVRRHSIGFNHAVLLATTSRSWHGFQRIELPEGKRHLSRKSVAVYYYTEYVPTDDTAYNRSTVYVDRPLPAHLRAGHTIDERDQHELEDALALRSWHSHELLQEILDQYWYEVTRLQQGHVLNDDDVRVLQDLQRTLDKHILALEHEHLRLRNRDKPIDLSAIGES